MDPRQEGSLISNHPENLRLGSIKNYFENSSKIRFRTTLHGLMRDEVFNFADGQRSYYDIYKGVYAEASAGSWYYGTVSFKDVAGLLDAGVETKALTLK